MESYDSSNILEELTKATNKWGLYIHFNCSTNKDLQIKDILQACLFLNEDKHYQIINDQRGYFLFNTEVEMEKAFYQCVGDDGPTELNKYNGYIYVYAFTCSPTEGILTENTWIY